ncbi:S-layer homology domain-containing protein [Leptolyngbya sp. DQ-M1]|uniref:S-layer homology domain-containing protein n=1 Tax=Leptolyngbya sp. DQ-M1 TaxID=2933920 RepID=UPI0032985BFA
MGFMRGYPDNTFRPRQSVTRVEALTSLSRNLELRQRVPSTPQSASTPTQATPTQATQTAAQPTRQRARRQIFFPIAALTLIQPLMRTPAAASQPAQPTQQAAGTPTPTGDPAQVPARTTLSRYYDDANQVPQYAIDSVANVTRAGIVVNHPNRRLLKPNQPATRGEMAAFIHQALVNQGRLLPLADNVLPLSALSDEKQLTRTINHNDK